MVLSTNKLSVIGVLLLQFAGTTSSFTFHKIASRASFTSRLAAKKKVKDDDKDKQVSVDPAKRAALDGVLNQIERTYGRGSVVKLGDAGNMVVDCVGSGAPTLDFALGGGYPKGWLQMESVSMCTE